MPSTSVSSSTPPSILTSNMRHGGKILIDQLAIQGVKRIFEVPGESFLAALDGLYEEPRIQTIVARHEGGAAMMAEATGKLTGRPGVAFVTRGPGACNATAGVYIASLDATPMLLVVGLPPRRLSHQAPFQDLDLEALFSKISKWTAIVEDTSRIPEYVARAFHIALAGRKGPVVLGFPEDVLSDAADAADAPFVDPKGPAPSEAMLSAISNLLLKAERPIVLVGGPGWSASAQRAVEDFAHRLDLPVAAAFRCQDYIDHRHSAYVGHCGFGTAPALREALENADVILALGAELGEISTGGYRLIENAAPKQTVIHVHPAGEWAGGIVRADLSVPASPESFAEALPKILPDTHPSDAWRTRRAYLREAYLESFHPAPVPGDLSMARVVHTVSRLMGETAITTNGAGNYSQFVHRHIECRGYRSALAPICGYMGYGIPAAIAAKLEHPERPVVAFAGDGCMLMTATELSAARQAGVAFVVIVANNGMYGTIRMHQERRYPGRVSGTDILNPDFAALARSFGCEAETLTSDGQIEDALLRALRANAPYIIELKLNPEAITPSETLSEIRRAAT